MSPEQSRAARAWLDVSQEHLAKEAGVSLSTVRDFEKGRRVPIPATLAAMRAVLESEGVGFSFAVEDGRSYACGITFSRPGKLDA